MSTAPAFSIPLFADASCAAVDTSADTVPTSVPDLVAPVADVMPPEVDIPVPHTMQAVGAATHWVSTRMSSSPPIGLAPAHTEVPLVGPAIARDIIVEIERLRRDLASADEALLAPPEPGTSNPLPSRESVESSVREPLPLPQPPVVAHEDEQIELPREPSTRHIGATLGWFAVGIGAVLLAVGIRHYGAEPAARAPLVAAQLPAAESSANPSRSFSRAAAALVTNVPELEAAVTAQPAENVAPGVVLAEAPIAVVAVAPAPEAMADPVDTVTVRGLPPSVTMSAGRRISETDWTIAAADAGNLALVVPHDQAGPVRADIEVTSRDGFVLARLGLNIVRETPPLPQPPVVAEQSEAKPETPAPVTSAPVASAAPVAPAPVASAPIAPEVVAPPAEEPAPEESVAETPVTAPSSKAKVSRVKIARPMNLGLAKVRPVAPVKTAPVMAAPPPRGLFQIGPTGVSVSTAPPPPATPASPASAPPPASKPKLPEPDQSPGFETLETLGGGFVLNRP
jgi:hypothetical protein